MPWASSATPQGTLELTQRDERLWAEDRVFHFAVVEKESGMVLGVAGINREGPNAGGMHYWIRTSHSGRGLTTEAGLGLIAWARDELDLPRLNLWAGTDNHASRRVAQKLGFVHVGPLSWRPEGGLGDFPAESYELLLRSEERVR
jgi:RimJ/RimL family protein N-acetyltransferase